MNGQSQWLFEAPVASEATLYTNPYSNPEWETEWELQEINPYVLGEEEWEHEVGYPLRGQTIRETISGFSRYSNAIPAQERVKIGRIARMIVQSYRSGQPILAVRLVGHADRDVQRGANFEKKISGDRALAVQKALIAAIKNPSIASQISWRRVSSGASRLIVQNPKTETERLRNRRVEVFSATRLVNLEAVRKFIAALSLTLSENQLRSLQMGRRVTLANRAQAEGIRVLEQAQALAKAQNQQQPKSQRFVCPCLRKVKDGCKAVCVVSLPIRTCFCTFVCFSPFPPFITEISFQVCGYLPEPLA